MSCGTLDTSLTSTTSVTGLLPCLVLLSNNLLLAVSMIPPVRTPKIRRSRVWALSRSLAATTKIDVSFSSSGYLDVSVHRVPRRILWIGMRLAGVFPAGFPHSDICGSVSICLSPQLFAAYHVFHRLSVPRHPPCALVAFFLIFFFRPHLACGRLSWFLGLFSRMSCTVLPLI